MYLDQYYDHSYDFSRNGEAYLIERLRSLNPDCIFDVGANIGDWSKLAADMLPSTSIHAFELSESTFATLTENICNPRVKKNMVGLSDRGGAARYKEYQGRSGSNTLIKTACYYDREFSVIERDCMLMTGDEYCQLHKIDKIDLLKIDVEGADYLVLNGFDAMLRQRKIRVVQFEYGYSHADAGHSMRRFFTFFNERGYTVGKLWADGVEFTKFVYWFNNYKSGPNFVAVISDDAEALNLIARKGPPIFSSFQEPPFHAP